MLEETKEKFRNIYTSKPDTVEWMIAFGAPLERAIGTKIKETALSK